MSDGAKLDNWPRWALIGLGSTTASVCLIGIGIYVNATWDVVQRFNVYAPVTTQSLQATKDIVSSALESQIKLVEQFHQLRIDVRLLEQRVDQLSDKEDSNSQ